MKTKEQIEQEFRAELQALLDKYGAELEAKDHYQGYPECGEDVRMTVDIPGVWDKNGDPMREYTEIDLGSHLHPTRNQQEKQNDDDRTAAPGAQTAPTEPDGWQPIETAPKDGTHVLLANKTGTRVADGMYGNYKVWSWPYVMVEPAYWRPMPAAPGAQENDGA